MSPGTIGGTWEEIELKKGHDQSLHNISYQTFRLRPYVPAGGAVSLDSSSSI